MKSEIKPPNDHHCQASRHNVSSETSLRQEFPSVSKIDIKSDEAQSRYKQAGLKVRSDDAVPTFTQKLTLAHRRRLGMAKQWSMDETQSWFRQEIVSSKIKIGSKLKLSFLNQKNHFLFCEKQVQQPGERSRWKSSQEQEAVPEEPDLLSSRLY